MEKQINPLSLQKSSLRELNVEEVALVTGAGSVEADADSLAANISVFSSSCCTHSTAASACCSGGGGGAA